MKYCPMCGKELMDAAVVCVHCGCAVSPMPQQYNDNSEYNRLVSFAKSATIMHILTIIALVLAICFVSIPIALILALVVGSILNNYKDVDGNYVIPDIKIANYSDQLMYENAKRKMKSVIRNRKITKWIIIILLLVVLLLMLTFTIGTLVFYKRALRVKRLFGL